MSVRTIAAEWELHLGGGDTEIANPAALLRSPENRFLRPLVRPGKKILEAGAGNGRYVFAFAAEGATAVGVDFAPLLVDKVRAQAAKQGWENVSVVTGDILHLPFPENEFDLYTSFGVYEHFTRPQHKLLFAEAYRALKPGGLIYLEVPHFWSAWTVRREIRYWFRKIFPPPIVWQRNMRRSYLTHCAERAGFRTVESHVFDAAYGFQKGFSLDCQRLNGVPNPFYFLRSLFQRLAGFCEPREWLGHTLVYIGQKPE